MGIYANREIAIQKAKDAMNDIKGAWHELLGEDCASKMWVQCDMTVRLFDVEVVE